MQHERRKQMAIDGWHLNGSYIRAREATPGTWDVGHDPSPSDYSSVAVFYHSNATWRCEGCGELVITLANDPDGVCAHIKAVLNSNPTRCDSPDYECDEVACGTYNIDGMAATGSRGGTPLCPHHFDALQKSVEV